MLEISKHSLDPRQFQFWVIRYANRYIHMYIYSTSCRIDADSGFAPDVVH